MEKIKLMFQTTNQMRISSASEDFAQKHVDFWTAEQGMPNGWTSESAIKYSQLLASNLCVMG